MSLKIETTVHVDDKSGREYLRFTPVFKPTVMAQGELRFAAYDCWLDEPNTHESSRASALKNARQVIAKFNDAINNEDPPIRTALGQA